MVQYMNNSLRFPVKMNLYKVINSEKQGPKIRFLPHNKLLRMTSQIRQNEH